MTLRIALQYVLAFAIGMLVTAAAVAIFAVPLSATARGALAGLATGVAAQGVALFLSDFRSARDSARIERRAAEQRTRDRLNAHLDATRTMVSAQILDLSSLAVGQAPIANLPPMTIQRGSIQLLGDDALVSEFGSVMRDLIAAVPGAMTPDLQRRASAVHGRALTALNLQEARVDRGENVLVASEAAVVDAAVAESYINEMAKLKEERDRLKSE